MIEFYKPDSIPENVLHFWRERQLVQDRFMALTASPEWYGMMVEHRGSAVTAVVRDGAGACRAILPLLPMTWSLDFRFAGRCWHRRHLSVMRVNGGDLIEDGVTQEYLAAAWRMLAEECPALQGIWFDHVASEARSARILESCRVSTGFFLHRVFTGLPHYRLKLPATVEEFRQLRSRESLKKIQGREKALCKAVGGECRLVEIRRPTDWAPHSEKIVELMDRRWQNRRLGHQFNMASLLDVAGRGWLRSFLLMAGNKVAAFAFCFQGNGVFVYEQIGYDERFARFSPGTILLYHLLERLYVADTPECVDFGEGEAEYKNLLANDVVSVDGLLIVNRRKAGAMPFRLVNMFRKADVSLRHLVGRMRPGRT